MKIIRNNIFETNSSSTHCLVTVKESNYKLPEEIDFEIRWFGWETETYYDTPNKASYLITVIYYGDDSQIKDWLKRLGDILDSHNIRYSFPEVDKRNMDGAVDHGCCAFEWLEDLLSNEDKLFRFLFDNSSYITTSSDNGNGYYLPEIGYQDDYLDENYDFIPGYQEKLKKLQEDFDIFYKGN